jgi:hypothetical protein
MGASVLDLGVASGANLEFLSQYARRFHFADLTGRTRVFEGVPLPAEGQGLEGLIAGRLEGVTTAPFDLVLAWDLFDYLTLEQVASLVAPLARHCRSGARLFCLVSIQERIPYRPRGFEIAGPDRLLYQDYGAGERPGPRHSEPGLARALKGFEVDRGFLLRNGVKEYLFLHQGLPVEGAGKESHEFRSRSPIPPRGGPRRGP